MKMESIWHRTVSSKRFPVQEEELSADVAVIGGGITGILSALLLQEAGFSVVVLERDRIGCGETGNSTAKITSQHAGRYAQIRQALGEEAVRRYAGAAESAIRGYREIVERYRIDCDFQILPSYLYTCKSPETIEAEYHAVQCSGCIRASLVSDVPLPFPVKKALLFPEQAQLHPLRFLYGVAEHLTIFERTQVIGTEKERLLTNRGVVRSRYILFACHFPFRNFPGMYFTKMHQSRTSLLALRGAPAIGALCFSVDPDGLTFRDFVEYRIFGGAAHRTGEVCPGGTYPTLRKEAERIFPGAEVAAMWSAQDAMPADGLPYIGRFSRLTPNTFVATGFGKWGFSTAYTAARLITDRLKGQENQTDRLFAPARISLRSIPARLSDAGVSLRGLSETLFSRPSRPAGHLQNGEGAIVEYAGKKYAAYRDESGKRYLLSPRCPHLGCELHFNPDEKSWDCPCHGSRFSYDGKRLSGPAETDLPVLLLPSEKSSTRSGTD